MSKQPRNYRIVTVCAVLALTSGLNSCAWMSNTMSRAKERIMAMRDRMKATPPAEETAAAPEQVAAASAPSGVGGGGGHHVIAGTGKPIGNSHGECVNTGANGAAHGGGCGGAPEAVAQADAAAPAPIVEATPMNEPAPVTGAEVTPQAPAAPLQAPATQAEIAQPSEELFPPATEPMAAAEPAAPTPPAPPVVEQAMPKPPAPTEKFSLAADALFPFAKHDEASMLPAGKAKLAELAERIKQMGPNALSKVAITGHADRLGRTDRNQRLSVRRADTVRAYLVRLGVNPALMSATGKGEMEPLVYCKGNKRTAKLKNCLAPNRRVDVAFFGEGDKMAQSR